MDWSFLPRAAVPGQHGVYLVRDSAGAVLYVGHTKDLRLRMGHGHRYRSAWFPQMASVEFLACDGVQEARVLEKAKIAEHRPAANVIDVLAQQRARRTLPDEIVARLVELYEAATDAHLLHREAERAALSAYVADLREQGWTFSSIAHGLRMTRQAVQQRFSRDFSLIEQRAAA